MDYVEIMKWIAMNPGKELGGVYQHIRRVIAKINYRYQKFAN